MGAVVSFPGAAEDVELATAHAAAASVCDPEVPVLTIADLGVLRDVRRGEAGIEVVITPTYSGCPAMDLIALQVDLALEKAGIARRKVTLSLSPAWTTDWMSEAGRRSSAPMASRRRSARRKAAPPCSGWRPWPVRIVVRRKPNAFPSLARRRARRIGAAAPAASRSIISSAFEGAGIHDLLCPVIQVVDGRAKPGHDDKKPVE